MEKKSEKIWTPVNIEPMNVDLSFGTISAVVLGEHGRGRSRAVIPADVAPAYTIGRTRIGNIRLNGTDPDLDPVRFVARINCDGPYTRGTRGWAGVMPEHVDLVRILAIGNGAFGDAGRIGTWYDYLVTIEPTDEHPVVPILVAPASSPGKVDRYVMVFRRHDIRAARIIEDEYSLAADAEGYPQIDLGQSILLNDIGKYDG